MTERSVSLAAAELDGLIAPLKDLPGALLPVLHAVQDRLGFIPREAVPAIAAALHLSRAEMHGVIGYYAHFREAPPGLHVVALCRAEACQAVGADALADHAKNLLGCDFHQTTADGRVSLEPVYCLGHCAVGPSVTIDDQPYGRVTPERFDRLLAGLDGAAE